MQVVFDQKMTWTSKSLCAYHVFLLTVLTFNTVNGNEPPNVTNIQDIRFIIKPENTPINSTLGIITALDTDGPQELIFNITEATTRDLVRLGAPQGPSTTGRSVAIILITELDCDRQNGQRKLYFQVSDKADGSGNNIPVVISLFISDVNDEDPTFNNSRYKGSVMENASMGTVVLTVNTTDSDTGQEGTVTYSLENASMGTVVLTVNTTDPDTGQEGTVTYSLEPAVSGVSEEYRTAFLINPTSGAITVYRSLDFETFNFYEFTLIARDGGGRNGTADLLITVNDTQDTPPAFYNLPYSVSIPENVSLGTSILQLTALDGDRGVANIVNYSFIEGSFDFFSLDTVTGVISVKTQLDRDSPDVRDKGGVYDMKVKASEVVPPGQVNMGVTTATTLVTITVIDVNDNSPQFNSLWYNATILENMQQGVPITFTTPFTIMNVSDIDQGSNSHYELFLEKDGRHYSDFTTHPSEVFSESSILICVNNQSALDYEITHQLTFQIIAREKDTAEHRSSTAIVTVHILNVNDNEPIFDSGSYNATVKENSQNGTLVAWMQAHDADLGEFGKLTYSVRGSNDRFAINTTTGEVFVKGELDRENVDKYFLTVEAKDGGGFRTPVELEVTILDENDNPPLFRRNEYYGTVQENRMNFTRGSLQIQAVDDDEPNSPNSLVLYRISKTPSNLTSNFTVDNQTGVISLTQSLDYEKLDPGLEGKIILIVEAYDNGVPRKSSFINVTVEVEGTSIPQVTTPDGDRGVENVVNYSCIEESRTVAIIVGSVGGGVALLIVILFFLGCYILRIRKRERTDGRKQIEHQRREPVCRDSVAVFQVPEAPVRNPVYTIHEYEKLHQKRDTEESVYSSIDDTLLKMAQTERHNIGSSTSSNMASDQHDYIERVGSTRDYEIVREGTYSAERNHDSSLDCSGQMQSLEEELRSIEKRKRDLLEKKMQLHHRNLGMAIEVEEDIYL